MSGGGLYFPIIALEIFQQPGYGNPVRAKYNMIQNLDKISRGQGRLELIFLSDPARRFQTQHLIEIQTAKFQKRSLAGQRTRP